MRTRRAERSSGAAGSARLDRDLEPGHLGGLAGSAHQALPAYDGLSAAWQSLATYFEFYNARRPRQTHDGRTLDMVYLNSLQELLAAA
jgi:hypothetical protein